MAITAAQLMVRVGADTGDAERGLDSFSKKMGSVAKSAGIMGGVMTAGVTMPLLAVAKQGLQSAAGFEQSMNVMAQVTGATTGQMSEMQAMALRLGADTSFSAGEAAEAMLELGKAGMGAEDIMASIEGVMDLAAAGGVGLADAAAITAATLNAFNLEADQSAYIANLLAGAANASAADISDLSQGMQQAGFAFNAANQPVETLAASLAILTNVGLTGSDAGTALKNAFMRMMNPTEEAKGVMRELGISFYDARGQMKPLPALIDNLNSSMDGLTEEQRNAALATIFLSDGMKAMIPLMNAGESGMLTMVDTISVQGQAAETAGARMSGLNGAMEYLSGSIDSFLIGAAQPFLGFFSEAIRYVADLITAFGALPEGQRIAIGAFLGIAAAAGPVLLAIAGIAGAIAFIGPVLLLVGAAAVVMGALWATNFGDMQTKTATLVTVIGNLGRYLAIAATEGDYLNDWLTHLPAAVQPAAQALGGTIAAIRNLGRYLAIVVTDGDYLNDWLTHLPAAAQPAAQALGETITTIQNLGRYLAAFAKDGDYLNDWLTHLPESFQPIAQALATFKGAWETAWIEIGEAATTAKDKISSVWSSMSGMSTKEMMSGAAKFTGGLMADIKTDIEVNADWGLIKVNAQGLVDRVQEQLSAIPWSQIKVDVSAFTSGIVEKIDEQFRNLGMGSPVQGIIDRVSTMVTTIREGFSGASLDAPLGVMLGLVDGLVAVSSTVGGIKFDVLQTMVDGVVRMGTSLAGMATTGLSKLDPAAVRQMVTGFATNLSTQMGNLFSTEKFEGLGTALGTMTATIITKVGDVFGGDGFGESVGTAIGKSAVAIADAANTFASTFADALADTDWSQFGTQLGQFVLGLVKGMFSQIGPALYENSVFNPETRKKAMEQPWADSGMVKGIGAFLGGLVGLESQTAKNKAEMDALGVSIVQSKTELEGLGVSVAPVKSELAALSPTIAPIQTEMAALGVSVANANTALANAATQQWSGMSGRSDILRDRKDDGTGAAAQVFSEAVGELKGFKLEWPEMPTFKWPSLPAWNWPGYPKFSWPPAPAWVGGLLDRADSMETRMFEVTAWIEDQVELIRRLVSGPSTDQEGVVSSVNDDNDDGRPRRGQRSFSGGRAAGNVTVYATVSNDIDLNELAMRIAQAQRRRA